MKKTKYIIIFFIGLCVIISVAFFALEINRHAYISAYLPFLEKSHEQVINENPQISDIFYGASVDMSQLLPTSINYVHNKNGEDLIDIAHHLGINLFRITNTQRSFNNGKDAIYTKYQWDKVLNKMQSEGIRAIILIETTNKDEAYIAPNIQPAYLDLVKDYVINSGVLDNPDVYAVDLKNESVVNDNNIYYIKAAANLIKSKYANTKLTVGGWVVDSFKKDENNNEIYFADRYGAGKSFEGIVDFYSVHLYGFDSKVFGLYPDPYTYTNVFISSVRTGLDTTKPILIEEFGAGNGDKITDRNTLGSKELQANVYTGVYQAIEDDKKTENLLGSVAYVLYPRDRNTDGWNIIANNGDYFYPAAYVLQKFSTGVNNANK